MRALFVVKVTSYQSQMQALLIMFSAYPKKLSCFEIKHQSIGTCCKTLASLVDEDMKVIFYASEDNSNFKVHFCATILTIINISSTNSRILQHMLGNLSMSRI